MAFQKDSLNGGQVTQVLRWEDCGVECMHIDNIEEVNADLTLTNSHLVVSAG